MRSNNMFQQELNITQVLNFALEFSVIIRIKSKPPQNQNSQSLNFPEIPKYENMIPK